MGSNIVKNMLQQALYTQYPFIILYVMIGIMFLVIVAVIIYNNVTPKRGFKPKFDNNIRIYTFDYFNKVFTYFDKMNISSKKTLDEKEFLDQFMASDRYRVQDWLKTISQGKQSSQYIQAGIKINKKNRYVTSMMELTGCNFEAGIIHFESHLLPFATFTKIEGPFGNKRKYLLHDFQSAEDFLNSNADNALSAVYFFHLYHLDDKAPLGDYKKLTEINKEIVDLLLHYCNNRSSLYVYSKTEEVMIVTSSLSKIATMEMAYTLLTAIQQHLNFKVPNSNLGVAIGISTSTYYGKNLKKAINQASSMADAIVSGLIHSQTALFDPKFYEHHNKKIKHIDEVKKVIQHKTFRIYFTPTINLEERRQDFYFLTSKPYGTEINNFTSLLRISENIHGGSKVLINEVLESIKQVTKGKEIELSLTIPFNLARQFINCVSLAGLHNIKWIITFDEADLVTHTDYLQQLIDLLTLIINKGHKIALNLSSANSLLPSKINTLFSYFIVGKKFTTSMNNDPDQNNLKLIETEYKVYPGEIVYADLKDLDDMSICVHYSGKILQCDSVALPSSLPEMIPEEVINECLEDQNC